MKTNIKKLILKDKNSFYVTLSSNDIDKVLNEAGNALKNDVKIILFYNDKLFDKEKTELSKKLHQLCSIYDALFIICFRADIAQIIDCNGIFLDENSLSIQETLKIISKEKFILTNFENENSDLIIEVNFNDNNCENKIFRI